MENLTLDYSSGSNLWGNVATEEELPRVKADRRLHEAAYKRLLRKHPDDFINGKLRPNNRLNLNRELERDWDAAVNQILHGHTYREVAKKFTCSIGLLHKKVTEYRIAFS